LTIPDIIMSDFRKHQI